jgi:RHS repeat-associated protein
MVRSPRSRNRLFRRVLLALAAVLAILLPGAVSASAQSGFPSGITVSVGYADNVRPSGFFPTPWAGDAGVTFEGCAGSCAFDGGAVKLTNTTASAVTVNSVQVKLSTCTYDIWPKSLSLGPGQTLVFTQTVSGAANGCTSNGTFDTSDVGPNGVGWSGSCTKSGVVPEVDVTANSVLQPFTDASQVLDTGGIDLASCPSGTNESQPWTQINEGVSVDQQYGGSNPSEPQQNGCNTGQPVDCATGDFWHTFRELAIPGRGPALRLDLTYNSLAASQGSSVGFGWVFTYGMHLAVNSTTGDVTVVQENASTVPFTNSGGTYQPPSWAPVSLVKNSDGTYTFTRRHGGLSFTFSAAGALLSIADPNGYKTVLAYNSSGQLTGVTDPSGRSLSLAYGANGDVTQVTDPASRTVAFAYSGAGDLSSITDTGGNATRFTYDGSHRLLTMTDPRGGVLTNVYDNTGRVTSQTDPLQLKTTFSYLAGTTTITDPNGHVTREHFSNLLPVAVTRGYGTAVEATWKYAYDPATLGRTSTTDPNGNTSNATYDADGNQTSFADAKNRKTTATFNGFDEPLSVTNPSNVTTTYTYDASGNLTSISRPLGGSGSQKVSFAYGVRPGDVVAITDANGHTSQFTYDANGDLVSSTNPAGDTRTYAFDGLGELTASTSPRGNKTTYAYDARGLLTKIVDPLGNSLALAYDGDRNRVSQTDGNNNINSYAYDADNELTKLTRANGTVLQYAYDGDGNETSQTDAAGRVTAYGYDALERVTSGTDPLNRKTSFAYDLAGNRTGLTDPAGQKTTFGYDVADELTSISYSDGKTPNVAYTYTADGLRASMLDGTGTTSYAYDSLDRLSAETNGGGQTVSYSYDLNGNVTGITYPNGKTVTRAYDAANRLTGITDWLGHTTSLTADKDGNTTGISYPNGVLATSTFDAADRLTAITDANGATTLASFTYARDANGQLTSTTPTGSGQGASESYTYTTLNQLSSLNGSGYIYDAADNLTKLANGATLTYDAGNEATSYTPPGGTASTLTYDQRGNRLTGLNGVTYTYDQANRLTASSGGSGSAAGLIAGGQYHSLAVRNDGTVWAWGYNADGELGDGTTTGRTTPVQASGVSGATAVAAGDLHSLALTTGGTVRSWGSNAFGQLGDGTTTGRTTAIQVTGLSGATAVAAGNYHSLALRSDGSVVAWGLNGAGELGDGTVTNRTTPVAVQGLSGAVAIAAGGLPGWAGHSAALKSDGTVWTWGYNKHGQLGLGTTTSTTTPQKVAGLTGVVAITASGDNTYALKSDGTVWAWGDNGYGQLGNTSVKGSQSTSPVQVSISGVAAIAAGGTHALALKSDGTVWAWGNNNTGQLGDGGACGKTCTAPVKVVLSNVTVLAAGYVHSLAALADGTVRAWGRNAEGELGDGTTTVRATPVTTTGLSGVKPTSASGTYAYDGDGLRASKTSAANTSHFAWDVAAAVPRLLTDGSTSYIYDASGAPIEQIGSNGTPLYFQHDQLGSTRLLTDSTGAVAATYTYDPTGNLTSHTGASDTALRWGGQYQDANTGLYYLRARYYDPATSQFLTRDPIAPVTQQPYGYVGGNPLNWWDPTGLGCSWRVYDCVEEGAGAAWGALQWAWDEVATHADAISTVTGNLALLSAAVGCEPCALALGSISAITGAIAAGEEIENGDYLWGTIDSLTAAIGAAAPLAKLLDEAATLAWDANELAIAAKAAHSRDELELIDQKLGVLDTALGDIAEAIKNFSSGESSTANPCTPQ